MNDADGQAQFVERLPALLHASLPAYLAGQRWFGDKARTISSVEISEIVPIHNVDYPAALVFLTVQFELGDPADYVLAIVWSPIPPSTGESLACDTDGGFLIDGLTDASVRRRLLSTIAGTSFMNAAALLADRDPEATASIISMGSLESRLLGAEQSNTSVLYGSDVLIKIFRRAQPGPNPEVELTRFLSSRAKFRSVPRYLGSISYRSSTGQETVIACAQAFVANEGDGWSFVLESIRKHLSEPNAIALVNEGRLLGQQLGVVSAQMHLALASDPWTLTLAPEPIQRADTEAWASGYLGLVDRVAEGLATSLHGFDAKTLELAELFLSGLPGLRKREGGFSRLIGRTKQRVHGDYHLGQMLRTLDGKFVIIDFEGEPQRSIEERRQKTSPLKDVAGMLRSFSYARGTATAWLTESTRLLSSDLVAWEREARGAFIAGYLDTARAGAETFLPASAADCGEALAAWELDKAAYEVLYEINNRPDWLWIPLSGMLKQGGPGN